MLERTGTLANGIQIPGDLELDDSTLAALQELAQTRPKAEVEGLIEAERRRQGRQPAVTTRALLPRSSPGESSKG